ncbi:MAG: hypothetical protein IK123_03145 [Lachnospiraceae bacterium]|nr:hypothetical protein [Lachnospiraceae bacterium]
MVQKKKNKTLTFIFSLLPGAAEMYMGLMKNGLSLMLIFFASFMLPTMLRAGDIFMALVFVVWFFGFFHARNVASSNDEEFAAIKDMYIWEEFDGNLGIKLDSKKANRILAAILIIIGVSALWNNVFDIVCRYIPENIWDEMYPVISAIPGVVVAILIIAAGIILIKGKKESISDPDMPIGIEDKSTNSNSLSA